MQIIILDEEKKTLCDYMDKYSDERDTVGPCFSSPEKLLEYLAENRVGEECLIIMAIHSAGMARECEEAIATLKATHADIKLILCMGVLSRLEELFRLTPDYMLSLPIDDQALQEAIEACKREFARQQAKYIAVPRNGKKLYIDVDSIIYIESRGRLLTINLVYNREVVFYMQMGELLEKLPEHFVRCHQSFSVNIRYARAYNGEKILLLNHREIPVSKRYRNEIRRISMFRYQK